MMLAGGRSLLSSEKLLYGLFFWVLYHGADLEQRAFVSDLVLATLMRCVTLLLPMKRVYVLPFGR